MYSISISKIFIFTPSSISFLKKGMDNITNIFVFARRQMQGRNGKRASQNGQNLRTAIKRGQPIRGRRRGGLAKGPLLLPAVQGEKDLKAAASWNERKKQNDGNKQEKESVALQQVEANELEAIYQTANSNEVLSKEPINEDYVDVECKEEASIKESSI